MGSQPNLLQRERVIVLVKALPHAGQRHGETVCCAGVTEKGEWRRQFPVHFRRLDEKFNRWNRIDYEYRLPTDDRRIESRRVQEDTIRVTGKLSPHERSKFLSNVVVASTARAAEQGQSLALIRPLDIQFRPKKKTSTEIDAERRAYKAAAQQLSIFDKELSELEPCPYAFKFKYRDEDGHPHESTCDDWETAATYWRFSKQLGEQKALTEMHRIFEREYPEKGMAFALGTHSRYPDVWLLVGVLRLDRMDQLSLSI